MTTATLTPARNLVPPVTSTLAPTDAPALVPIFDAASAQLTALTSAPKFVPTIAPAVDAVSAAVSAPTSMPTFEPTIARTGARNLIRRLGLLLQWNFNGIKEYLPMIIVIQALMAVLTVFGYSMFLGDVPLLAAQYLVAGSVTVQIMTVGLVMTPQNVSTGKQNGSLGWFRTLPVPRMAFFLADVLVYGIVSVPAALLSLFLGQWHLGVTLSITPWLIPAALLIAIVAATIGYSLALLLPPQVAQLATQVIIFIILMFSPINFPASNMPTWLATAHQWLPFAPIAELMRSNLMSDVFTMPVRSAIVLAIWTILALIGSARVLTRRV